MPIALYSAQTFLSIGTKERVNITAWPEYYYMKTGQEVNGKKVRPDDFQKKKKKNPNKKDTKVDLM